MIKRKKHENKFDQLFNIRTGLNRIQKLGRDYK